MNYKHTTLKNGLNIFLLPLKDAESVSYTIYTKVGSRYENPKHAGIAHFLEHLFFKGSKQYPSAEALSAAVDAIGGEWNASTGKEVTEFYIKSAKSSFNFTFNLLTDMLQNPLFDEGEIEREKGVIIEEMRMYRDNLPNVSQENLEKAMWPGTKMGDTIIGTEESIKGITRKEIVEFWNTWYTPQNMIVGVSGNFDLPKTMAKIKQTWGSKPATPLPKLPKTGIFAKKELQKRTGPQFSFEKRATEQVNMAMGFATEGFQDKRSSALRVLASVLGGGMSSRLFLNVRERKGLAYTVYATNDNYVGAGMFMVYAGVRADSAEKAIDAIRLELQSVATTKLSDAELRKSKEFIKGHTALRLEDPQSKLDFLVGRFIAYGSVKLPKQVLKEIEEVSAKQIMTAAQSIFKLSNAALSIVAPKQNDAAYKKAFTSKK